MLCLFALHHILFQVHVPEVYVWTLHEGQVFIDMELGNEDTLEEAWDPVDTEERADVCLAAQILCFRAAGHAGFFFGKHQPTLRKSKAVFNQFECSYRRPYVRNRFGPKIISITRPWAVYPDYRPFRLEAIRLVSSIGEFCESMHVVTENRQRSVYLGF